jgi:hypothetical protein
MGAFRCDDFPGGRRSHRAFRQAGARLYNDEVVHLDGSPPMFFFADPDGNGLVYLEEEPGSA